MRRTAHAMILDSIVVDRPICTPLPTDSPLRRYSLMGFVCLSPGSPLVGIEVVSDLGGLRGVLPFERHLLAPLVEQFLADLAAANDGVRRES